MSIKSNVHKESGTKTIMPIVETKVTESIAEDILGKVFAKLAFGAFDEHEGDPVALYKAIKPALVVEKHLVTFVLGNDDKKKFGPFPVMPILGGIVPVKDEKAVTVRLQFPLVFESADFGGALLQNLGEVISVNMKTTQMELPGVQPAIAVVRDNAGSFGNGNMVAVQ